ncbi:isochorismatase family protein [Candidatus Woesearchaeota archaeon]|nr:isochorismatase family protein [Candidatus Woesearchaeota archaeon]
MDGSIGQLKIRESDRCEERTTVYGVNAGFIDNPIEGKKGHLHTKEGKTVCLERGETSYQSAILSYKDIIAFIKENISWKCADPFAFRIESERFTTAGIFFEKQHYDVATNPWFEKVLKAVAPQQAVVYGVATDYCVRAGALALKKAGVPEVYLVSDAIAGITSDGCAKALDEMVAAGVKLTTSKNVLEGKL